MPRSFREIEAKVLDRLAALGGDSPALAIAELAEQLAVDQSPVSGAATSLADEGLVAIEEETLELLRLGPKASDWPDGRSPERRVAAALERLGGSASLRELPRRSDLEQKTIGQSLRWLAARGWAKADRGELSLEPGWRGADSPALEPDEQLVAALARSGCEMTPDELAQAGVAVSAALQRLGGRAGVVQLVEKRRRLARLTDEGRRVASGRLAVRREVNELTTDLLISGRWRDVDFREYDVTLPAARLTTGKLHPFRRILEDTRQAFLHMGFEETASPWVESGFWDFDALFQPQDHPARDMQDTFYVARPASCALPADELVDRVRETHQSGGETGSIGWGYSWSRQLSARCVLRTHTTSATVRALASDPHPPRKVFCVGPVFRRETIDYKHLPVFHQVDGIVIDERASFSALLTLLSTFYSKMGFETIQFRPAFFPYTEPSVEVFVWMEERRDWFEMGGAGVFRAEVTEPLGCRVPVLAWGLGLERLAMFRFGLSDIRELYLAHLSWLEGVRLCRS